MYKYFTCVEIIGISSIDSSEVILLLCQ